MHDHVVPAEPEYYAQVRNRPDWRQWKQPPVMETLKAKARAAGLWNLFLPDKEYGAGLTNIKTCLHLGGDYRALVHCARGIQLQRT